MSTTGEFLVPNEFLDSSVRIAIEGPLVQTERNSPPSFITLAGKLTDQNSSSITLRMSDATVAIPKHRIMYIGKISDVTLAPVSILSK